MKRTSLVTISISLLSVGLANAQLQSTHYPEPSTNGALHYNRALLSMSMIPLDAREALSQPIWEAFGSSSRAEIEQQVEKLTFEGRHALRAALKGTSCEQADFGIDYSDYGHGVNLPHVQPMLELGRLITLAGIQAQIKEDWREAAKLLFEGVRMGRHMANRPTLAESIVGVQILENNYYALAFWAAKCPQRRIVVQAFLRFEAATDGILHPAFILANEASIIERQMERVRTSYPDGPWAEMMLDSLGEYTLAEDKGTLEEKAKEIALNQGVPAAVFESKENFDLFVRKLSALRANYFRSLAACVTLPPQKRHQAANNIYAKAKAELAKFSHGDLLNPDDIMSIFAMHAAERTMARVALAAAANRQGEQFPPNLAGVASRFSGQLPTSPYDGAQLQYSVLNGGKDFEVIVPAAKTGTVELPAIEFSSLGRAPR